MIDMFLILEGKKHIPKAMHYAWHLQFEHSQKQWSNRSPPLQDNEMPSKSPCYHLHNHKNLIHISPTKPVNTSQQTLILKNKYTNQVKLYFNQSFNHRYQKTRICSNSATHNNIESNPMIY